MGNKWGRAAGVPAQEGSSLLLHVLWENRAMPGGSGLLGHPSRSWQSQTARAADGPSDRPPFSGVHQ